MGYERADTAAPAREAFFTAPHGPLFLGKRRGGGSLEIRSDDFRILKGIYERTYRDTGRFDQAFDSVLRKYCALNGREPDLRAQVDVGVLIAQAQMYAVPPLPE